MCLITACLKPFGTELIQDVQRKINPKVKTKFDYVLNVCVHVTLSNYSRERVPVSQGSWI
jgi:hypothetical protein